MISPLCGKPRDQTVLFGHVVRAARLRVAHRARPFRARHVGVARDAADPHRERAVLHAAVRVAVARRRARLMREVRFTARVDERGRVEAERAVVVERVRAAHEPGSLSTAASRPCKITSTPAAAHSRSSASFTASGSMSAITTFVLLGAHRAAHPAQRVQRGEHLRTDAADGTPRRIGLRPEPAVGQHAAARRRAAEKRRLLEQRDARPATRRADRRGDAGRAAAAHHDVVTSRRCPRLIAWCIARLVGRAPCGCVTAR